MEKILFLKQDGEVDILMPVVYEHLSDFCFCCGIIGHQYKECPKYQGQSKEELSYGVWMKAVIVGGRSRKYRSKEKWNNDNSRLESNHATSEHQGFSQQQSQSQGNPNGRTGSGFGLEEKGQTDESTRYDDAEGVVEEHLMKGMTELMTKQQSGGVEC